MTITRLLLGAALLLASPLVPSSAYQPPVVEPGGTWSSSVRATNYGEAPVTSSARARLRGHPYWGSPAESAVRGEWRDVGPVPLGPGESALLPVDLPVPARAPSVLAVEFQDRGAARWSPEDGRAFPMVEGSETTFRLVAGGSAHYDPEDTLFDFIEAVARNGEEWDALRARLGIVSPDSWGSHPDESDPPPPYGGVRPLFASLNPPNFETETLLAVRTPFHTVRITPRSYWIRSVRARADGTLVCRYSWRVHRDTSGRPIPGILVGGDFLLFAIPKTDAPVIFRRVP